jgi:hypothetical protein
MVKATMIVVKRLSRGFSVALFDAGDMAPPLFEKEGSLRSLAGTLRAWGEPAWKVGEVVALGADGNMDDALQARVCALMGRE